MWYMFAAMEQAVIVNEKSNLIRLVAFDLIVFFLIRLRTEATSKAIDWM